MRGMRGWRETQWKGWGLLPVIKEAVSNAVRFAVKMPSRFFNRWSNR